MAERAPPSLLERAIAASLAVVPVLLGVMLLVAVGARRHRERRSRGRATAT